MFFAKLEEQPEETPKGVDWFKIMLILLALVLLPAMILAYLYFFVLLQIKKQRLSVIFVYTVVILFISYLFNMIFSPMEGYFASMQNLSYDYIPFILKTVYLQFNIGIVLGFLFVCTRIYELNHSPSLKHLPGWAKGFKYAPTVFDKMKRKKNIELLKTGEAYDYTRAPMGITEEVHTPSSDEVDEKFEQKLKNEIAYMNDDERVTHTLVVGNTGSGKTKSMLMRIKNDIMSGKPVVVIDFKKSPELAYHVSRIAYEEGRQVLHFTNGKPGEYYNPFCERQASYTPLATGNSNAKADMVLNMREWDTAANIYQVQNRTILQAIYSLLRIVPPELAPNVDWGKGCFKELSTALKITNFLKLIEIYLANKHLHEDENLAGELRNLHVQLSDPRSPLRAQVDSLINICGILLMSDYGPWLRRSDYAEHIDLKEIFFDKSDKPPVVLFSFSPAEEAQFAKDMGSIIMSDLNRVTAEKQKLNDKNPVSVYVDEGQLLSPSTFKDLLEKARSAKVGVTLSFQSLEQVIVAPNGDEDTLRAMLDTCGNFFIHSGATEASAQRFSGILGKKTRIQYIQNSKIKSHIWSWNFLRGKTTGLTQNPVEEYVVPEKEISSLISGLRAQHDPNIVPTAFVITRNSSTKYLNTISGNVARKISVYVDKALLDEVPIDFIKALEKPPQKNVFIEEAVVDVKEEIQVDIPAMPKIIKSEHLLNANTQDDIEDIPPMPQQAIKPSQRRRPRVANLPDLNSTPIEQKVELKEPEPQPPKVQEKPTITLEDVKLKPKQTSFEKFNKGGS